MTFGHRTDCLVSEFGLYEVVNGAVLAHQGAPESKPVFRTRTNDFGFYSLSVPTSPSGMAYFVDAYWSGNELEKSAVTYPDWSYQLNFCFTIPV